jgi:hypothetical protein
MQHYHALHKINKVVPPGEWELEQYFNTGDLAHYKYYHTIKDTLYQISFDIRLLPPDKEEYSIIKLSKYFSDEKYKYRLDMHEGDSLFFYKESKLTNEKIFIMGKYYYIFSYFPLTYCQDDYLSNNLDSLRKIRGNFDPHFPCE